MKNESTLLKLRKNVKFLFFVTTWGEKIKQKPFIYFKYYESLLKIGLMRMQFWRDTIGRFQVVVVRHFAIIVKNFF